jgi:hypothetical protein
VTGSNKNSVDFSTVAFDTRTGGNDKRLRVNSIELV